MVPLMPTLRPTMDEHHLLDVIFDLESLSVELKQTISEKMLLKVGIIAKN